MITKEQVADLREGDVVELTSETWGEGTVLRGPLVRTERGGLRVGNIGVITGNGFKIVLGNGDIPYADVRNLRVISRAPRPLYLNSDRTEPVPGDVVSFKGRVSGTTYGPYLYTYKEQLVTGETSRWINARNLIPSTAPLRYAGELTLLVDGTTGKVVPQVQDVPF